MFHGRSWAKGALACAMLLAQTSAGAREQAATDGEKDAAGQSYIACQADKADRLDDGYSDAMTIGRAIAASCRPEMEALAAVLARGSSERMRLMLIDRLASHAPQDASVVVLLARKRRTEAGTGQR